MFATYILQNASVLPHGMWEVMWEVKLSEKTESSKIQREDRGSKD